MTTSGTKTRALCVATRCTSVDQFVATFHRFCGDDESFFVATMTSRPIGLETPFSIQLADKQPVLRGLCIVLDAWDTPENRYRRPGIRLGIKHLTADSQRVFDRLRAASKAGVAEATPPPGPPPTLPLVSRGSPPPALPLASRGSPPPEPPPLVSRGSPPPVPRPTAQPPPLPRVITDRREAVPDTDTPPPLPAVPAGQPSAPPLDARPAPIPEPFGGREPGSRPGAAPAAAPIAVTRFQVALNVDGTLPPTDSIEFRPRQLPHRPRVEPRIVSDPEPDAFAYEPAAPAMIVDRPSDPLRDPSAVPSSVAGEIMPRGQGIAHDALPASDLRTPGSSLVLPANPLQNLSDESIEGFVDCTLYEESGNFFHPPADDDEWNDALADPPAEPLSTRSTPSTPSGTVPAMPYDTAPDLTVLARGNSESLRVAPDAPSGPPQMMAPEAMPAQMMPPQMMVPEAMPPQLSSPVPASDALSAQAWPDAAHLSAPAYPTYPTVDPSQYPPQYATPMPTAMPHPVPPPDPETLQLALTWPRWLIIGGTAIAAIVVAFIIAKLVRGSQRAEHERAAASSVLSQPARPAAAPSPLPSNPSPSNPSPSNPPAPGPSRSAQDSKGATAPATANSAEPVVDPVLPDDDEDAGDAAPGGAPVVGNGPCRLTVATTPAASIVRLDDQPMGPSPLTIDATCEKHRVEISHARYQSMTRWVTLVEDKPQALDVNLQRPIHAVTVTSFPPGAELSIDGRRAGTTPTVVQMMGFSTVNLTFSKAGFQSVTKKVYSKLAQDQVFVKLMK
jgi:hypothetical protein